MLMHKTLYCIKTSYNQPLSYPVNQTWPKGSTCSPFNKGIKNMSLKPIRGMLIFLSSSGKFKLAAWICSTKLIE